MAITAAACHVAESTSVQTDIYFRDNTNYQYAGLWRGSKAELKNVKDWAKCSRGLLPVSHNQQAPSAFGRPLNKTLKSPNPLTTLSITVNWPLFTKLGIYSRLQQYKE